MSIIIEDLREAIKYLEYASSSLYLKGKCKDTSDLETVCRKLNILINKLEEEQE